MATNILNLSNIKISEETIVIEFLYRSKEFFDNFDIFMYDESNNKYNVSVDVCEEKVEYNSEIGPVKVAKVTAKLLLKEYGKLRVNVKNNDTGEVFKFKILNNKDESIVSNGNKYKIFSKKFIIDVLEDGFQIDRRKKFDLTNYEFFKFIYGIKKYKKVFWYRFFNKKNKKYYLFNDRLHVGDDNAEALFKYICENEKEFAKNCYFVLTKDSNAIPRLKKIGKVIKYGSIKHKIKFINCKMVISSHASYVSSCFNPFKEEEMDMYKDIISKQFVFVEHGIAMNDIRKYVNRCLITADLYTVATRDEYRCLSSKDYMYENGMVVGTGLARFDKLIDKNKKIILISPTWRSFVTDKVFKNTKEVNFENSEFYKKYSAILKNENIKKVMREKGYRIKFLLHPVFSEFKNIMKKCEDDLVEVLSIEEIKYSEMFNECSMLITDYSSIHFDVATLLKPIIYYQFDKDEFFSKHYQSGYFKYDRDGFGDVIEDEDTIEKEIIAFLKNDCKIKEVYKKKINDTFINLDKNNSKRVLEEIKKLDAKKEKNYRFNNVH